MTARIPILNFIMKLIAPATNLACQDIKTAVWSTRSYWLGSQVNSCSCRFTAKLTPNIEAPLSKWTNLEQLSNHFHLDVALAPSQLV